MQSITPKFGMIRQSDFKPGFAFQATSQSSDTIYVVKNVTGEPQNRSATTSMAEEMGHTFLKMRRTEQSAYDILSFSDPCLRESRTLEQPAHVFLPHVAEVFKRQADGSFLKTGESATPVYFTEGDENPYHNPVECQRDGDRLTVVG